MPAMVPNNRNIWNYPFFLSFEHKSYILNDNETLAGVVGLGRPPGLGRRLWEGVRRLADGHGTTVAPSGEADAVHDAAVPGRPCHQEGVHHLQTRRAVPKHGDLRRHSLRTE